MRRPRPLNALAALGVAATSVFILEAPAVAGDFYREWPDEVDTAAIVIAWWYDNTDTLCVKSAYRGHAVARMYPADGSGPSFSVTDYKSSPGRTCTGNLSIPEDQKYRVVVKWDDHRHPSGIVTVGDWGPFFS